MFRDVDEFINWLWPKLEWMLLMAGITGGLLGIAYLVKMFTSPSSQGQSQYRYPGLPRKCVCMECGYVVENPGKHCIEIKCPKCGGRMRRLE